MMLATEQKSSLPLSQLRVTVMSKSAGSLPLPTQSGENMPTLPAATSSLLATPGPYNPAATISPKVVRKILALEFVEMAELTVDDVAQTLGRPPAPTRPPITDISLWLERYAVMAAILATRFPCKAPELLAYQATIVRAEHNYEGKRWVSYDRQFRREALARNDLNWSVVDARLYNEAFNGWARAIARCSCCLADDHAEASCPQNPNRSVFGWLPSPSPWQSFPAAHLPPRPPHHAQQPREICRRYNEGRCKNAHRCRYWHACLNCKTEGHSAVECRHKQGQGVRPVHHRRAPSGIQGRLPARCPTEVSDVQHGVGPLAPGNHQGVLGEGAARSSNPEKVVLWAIACSAFFGFFRLGELLPTPVGAFNPATCLAWGDVAVNNVPRPTMIQFHLKQSKCDQFGSVSDVVVGATGLDSAQSQPWSASWSNGGIAPARSSWTRPLSQSQSHGLSTGCGNSS